MLSKNAGLTYTEIEKRIKELEGAFLIHRSHAIFMPLVPDAHRPQLDGRDANTREGGQGAITSKLGRWRRNR